MKIFTVVGARPQFVKAAALSKALRKHSAITEVTCHTGQHYDPNMSDVFFSQLGMPAPEVQLSINGGGHGRMTGEMLIEIEKSLVKFKPDLVLVYGDTNSTLAGAIAAAKLNIPVAHVEAGLRSGNREMPEEVNRILTDQLSTLLFCPTELAVANLAREGCSDRDCIIQNVGDVMHDAVNLFAPHSKPPPSLGGVDHFVLATVHRAENTDNTSRLKEIVEGLNKIHRDHLPVVLPLHPRTRLKIRENNISLDVLTIEPVGYLEMLWLLRKCSLVATDSGGLQKEAYFFQKYCLTLRDETEWVELLHGGTNKLVGANTDAIVAGYENFKTKYFSAKDDYYGQGMAADKIATSILNFSTGKK